jgi:hypothetical protein
MDVAFHTQGQGTKAVDPEAPALDQILALAADLTKDSSMRTASPSCASTTPRVG